jgi:hypothetical protein
MFVRTSETVATGATFPVADPVGGGLLSTSGAGVPCGAEVGIPGVAQLLVTAGVIEGGAGVDAQPVAATRGLVYPVQARPSHQRQSVASVESSYQPAGMWELLRCGLKGRA